MSSTDSSSSDTISLISSALNSSSSTTTAQVGIAVAVYFGIALVTIFLFTVIRPRHKLVFQPKLKYAEPEYSPPAMSDGIAAWVNPVFRTTDDALLPLLGLDAVTFMRFCRMTRDIITSLAILMTSVLVPIDVIYNERHSSTSSTQSGLNELTMANVSGTSVWAHVAMSYLGTIIALAFIWHHYRQMVRLRWVWFRSEAYQTHLYARSLMITNARRDLRSDGALAGVLSTIGMPYPTTDVHISRVVGKLPELIEEHDETVQKLERVFAKWLKNADRVPEKRPTMRIGGFAGMGGQQVDAIDYLTQRINKLEAVVEEWRERIAERKPESYGFASLATVPFAHAAAKSLRGKKPRGLHIELAPPPRDILWKNLNLTKAQRFKSSSWGFVLLFILLFINAVPLVGVALISQMDKFTGVLPFLETWKNASGYSFEAVAGILPPAISGIFGYFLPPLMRKLGKYRGVTTRNKLDRVITSQYFGFLIISQFVVFTLVGVAVTTIATIIHEADSHKTVAEIFEFIEKVPETIKYQYLAMANYWLTWIPLRLFNAAFDLSRVLSLANYTLRRTFFGRTPRDIRRYTKPPSFDYAIYYANFLFVFAVAMLYACLAPLVLVFTAVCLWLSAPMYKYMLMYVFVTKNESGGRLWRVVVNRLFICIIFMQLVLALAVALEQHWEAFACLPPILFVLGFKVYCKIAFDRQFDWYIPDANEMSKLKTHTGDASHHRLARRFGQPCLSQKLFTPMVHAKVKHLLPEVYSGRLEDNIYSNMDGRKPDLEDSTGGLKIAGVEEEDCMYDPKMDTDAASIFSSTTAGFARGVPSRAGTFDPAFASQYENYMSGGLQANRSVDAFEMNPVYHGSQENLLEKMRDNGDVANGQHGRKGSVGTFLTNSTRPSPQSEYPPPASLYRPATNGSMSSSNYFPAAVPGGAHQGYSSPQGRRQDTASPGHFYNNAPSGRSSPRPSSTRGYYGPRTESPQNLGAGGSPNAGAQRVVGYPPAATAGTMYSEAPSLPPPQIQSAAAMYGGAGPVTPSAYTGQPAGYFPRPPQQQPQQQQQGGRMPAQYPPSTRGPQQHPRPPQGPPGGPPYYQHQ